MDNCSKPRVEFLEAGEDSAKAFEPTEQALDFVAATIHNTIIFPGSYPVALRGNDGRMTQIKRPLPGFIPLAGTIHQQMDEVICRPDLAKQLATFRCIVSVSRRERKGYDRSFIRGNQMNFGIPSSPGLSDGLGAVFFNAPVPSG
jgi:hypothetical protein